MPIWESEELRATLRMIEAEHLDIRAVTMGISLRDCPTDDLASHLPARLRQDHALGAPPRRRGQGGAGRVRRAHHQQAHLGHADRARR